MALKLRPGIAADVPAMVEVYISAFASNMLHQVVFPGSSPQTHSFWQDSLSDEIQDPTARFLVVEDTSARIVAFAKWVAPLSPDAPPVPVPTNWPTDGDPGLANSFFGELAQKHEDIIGLRPHWYLECIGTRAEDQGKGAGGMLVRWGTERADEDGVEAYLDSTPEGVPVYVRYGFQEVEKRVYMDGKYEHYYMVRNAKPGLKQK